MATTRKTAAQKAAEAAEREEYTTPVDVPAEEQAPEPVTEAPKKEETVQQLKNRLRNEAEREVLNTHKDEVHRITKTKYDEHGLEYVRRLTDEEKAAKEIEGYYRRFPNLRPETLVISADPVPSGAEEGN